jgi:hypothetical protein
MQTTFTLANFTLSSIAPTSASWHAILFSSTHCLSIRAFGTCCLVSLTNVRVEGVGGGWGSPCVGGVHGES